MPHATPRVEIPASTDPKAARIAALSTEFLDADPERREEIGEEIVGLISGDIAVLPFGARG